MLAEITFEWDTRATEDQAIKLAELFDMKLEDLVKLDEKDGNKLPLKTWQTFIADVEDVKDIVGDMPFKIGKVFKSRSNFVGTLERFKAIADKLEAMPFTQEQQVNNKVDVHVPNLGLLLMDEVEVAYDFCTEALQDKIDDGWRILAICPQPDQRRPDYVLGRTKNK
jgi:hypothetical protein